MWNDLTMSERADVIKMAVKAGLRDMKSIRDFYDNSLKYADGGSKPGMTGMMKSKLAIASHFGNPTARRMTNYDTRNYTFPNRYDEKTGLQEIGNVYVSSYDNLVTPQIQDNGKELEFVPEEKIWDREHDPRSYAQSIKFYGPNANEDARYFGEHYKEVAPMMNLYADGGSIHISPSKRGTFTAAATKHGMGVQEFASKVLANKDNYSSAMVKKANFAKNASKWKHDLGGYLFI